MKLFGALINQSKCVESKPEPQHDYFTIASKKITKVQKRRVPKKLYPLLQLYHYYLLKLFYYLSNYLKCYKANECQNGFIRTALETINEMNNIAFTNYCSTVMKIRTQQADMWQNLLMDVL